MTTIKDIAKRAGVSISTVSHAFSGKRKVSASTIEEVMRAAEELGYSPNKHAQSLPTKHSRTIALIVPDIANPYYSYLLCGAEKAGQDYDFTTVLCNTDYQPVIANKHVHNALGWAVEAIIYVISSAEDKAYELILHQRPILVFCDEVPIPQNCSSNFCVELDNWKAGSLAAEHLAELGHRNVAFIGDKDGLRAAGERHRGFRETFKKLVSNSNVIHIPAGYRIEDGTRIAPSIIDLLPKLTAVFCANDLVAMGLMNHLQKGGISIPEQLSVIGVDDCLPLDYFKPGLTTIRQPVQELGYKAVEISIKAVQGEISSPIHIQLTPYLHKRESCIPHTNK
jgi:LacI family transcriptional regulator